MSVTSNVVKRRAAPCTFSFFAPGTGSGAVQTMASKIDGDSLVSMFFSTGTRISNGNAIADTIVSNTLAVPVDYRPLTSQFFPLLVNRSSLVGNDQTEIVNIEITSLGGMVIHRLAASSPFQPVEIISFVSSCGNYGTH